MSGNNENYWCELCQFSCKNESSSIRQHSEGKLHVKNASHQEILLKLSQEYDCFEQTQEAGSKGLRCKICNILATSPGLMESHLNGSKHKSKMEAVLKAAELQTMKPKAEDFVSKLNKHHPGFDYKVNLESRPHNDSMFTVNVELYGNIFSGTARTKKQAKQAAAKAAVQYIENHKDPEKRIILDSAEFDALEDHFEDNFKGDQTTTKTDDIPPPSILSKHSLSWLVEKGLCSTATLEELTSQGLNHLTHIQYISFPHLINKVDCFLHARTGSGKTLAYLMPAIERLKAMGFKPEFGVGCLVVSPTRELALQIKKVLEPLAAAHNFTTMTLIGGIKENRKENRIATGAVIVVATSGRLLDAVRRREGGLPLSKCKIFIIDEADSVLENSSQVQDVKKIYSHIPNDKLQKILVSATVNDKSLNLANDIFSADFKVLSTEKEKNSTSTEQIKQNYVLVSSGDRFSMLVTVLKTLNKKKTIVFFSSGHSVKFHYRLCQQLGLPVLHCFGRMRQGERTKSYEKFAEMTEGILLSTGMAERGWDIPGVQWIIQFDPPHNPQDYVHRVGRSGRGEGATGKALLFLSPQEREFLTILKNMKVDIDELEFQGNLQPIQEQIVMLVTTERELKLVAKTAYKKFVRSYQCHQLKKVFNVKKLDLGQVCKDFGFLKPPVNLHLERLK